MTQPPVTHFWEYESKTSYNAKQADSFAQQAQKSAWEQLIQRHATEQGVPVDGTATSPDNLFNPTYFNKSDVNSIEKPVSDTEGSSSGGLLHGLDNLATTIFGGKVRQPWDLLRPVQRALEAEQNYVARPIAKAVLSPFGDYNNLPGIVRAGAEVLFDPLTYIGPGTLLEAAHLAPALKLAAPGLDALFSSQASKRLLAHVVGSAVTGLGAVAGGEAARALGAPPLVGSLIGGGLAGGTLGKRFQPARTNSIVTGNQRDFNSMSNEELNTLSQNLKTTTDDEGKFTTSADSLIARQILDRRTAPEAQLKRDYLSAYSDSMSDSREAQMKGAALVDRIKSDAAARDIALPSDKSMQNFLATRSIAEDQGKDYPYAAEDDLLGVTTPKSLSYGPGSPAKGQPADPGSAVIPLVKALDDAAAPNGGNMNQYLGAKTVGEVQSQAASQLSATMKLRSVLGARLEESGVGQKINDFLRNHGLRLSDTEVTPLIDAYAKMSALGPSYAAANGWTIGHVLETANKDATLSTKDTVVSGHHVTAVTDNELISQAMAIAQAHPEFGLMKDGVLGFTDLMSYAKHFDLTPAQDAVLQSADAPMSILRTLEGLSGIDHPENLNGYDVHRQLIRTEIPNESGRLVESTAGPVVSMRRGATQGFEKNPNIPSEASGRVSGNQYLPFVEAQAARTAQGYRAMADIWLNKAVDGMGRTASQLVPTDVQDNFTTATTKLGQLKNLDSRVGTWLQMNSVPNNAWLPPKWTAATPDIQNVIADLNIASNVPKASERRAAIQEVRSRLKDLLTSHQDEFDTSKLTRQRAIQEVAANPQARGAYPTPFKGQYYGLETGQQLQDAEKINSSSGLEGSINKINDTLRPVMATLDASFLGVQGLVAALSNPVAYWKAATTVFRGVYGDYQKSLYDSGALHSMIQDGVHWASRNDFSEFIFPSAIRRLPVVGPLADVSNAAFSQFGNVLRSELYKASPMSGSLVEADRQQLARNVNLVSGFTSSDPSQVEKTLSFAPRFFRSQLGLIADALTKHSTPGGTAIPYDLTEGSAARSVGSFLALGSLMTAGLNEVLGNKTDLNPDSPNFMRVRFGGQDWSIFGTWDTLARAISKETHGPGDGVAYLARVKASPVVGRLFDVIQGQTLSGQKLSAGSAGDILNSALKEASGVALPISIQQLVQQPPDPTNPASIAGSAIQFLGTKSSPLSPSERMAIKRDQVSESTFKKPWSQLEPFQQDQLRKDNNLDSPAQTDLARSFNFRTAISNDFQSRQSELDNQLPVGKDWIDAYHSLKTEQVGAYAQWAKENPDAQATVTSAKPRNAQEAVRSQFYSLFDQADKQKWTAEETSQAVTQFQDSLTPDQRAYLERNTGLKDTPRVVEYKAAQKVLAPYWNVQDEVWNRLKGRLPQGAQFASAQDFTNDLVNRLQDAGLSDSVIVRRIQTNPVLREIDRATTALRSRIRARNPQINKELIKWYGYSPTSLQ